MPLMCPEKVYCLRLANGHGWTFVATEGTGSWMDRLASIMGLEPCELNDHPRIILTKEELHNEKHEEPVHGLDPNISMSLPGNGWKNHVYDNTFAQIRLRAQFWYHNDVPDVIYWVGRDERHETSVLKMWTLSYFISHREQLSGGFPFHSGLVELDGKGVLLAARGGTGKSTCCSRIPPPWRALADDQALVIPDKQGRYVAHPLPTWSNCLWKRSRQTWEIERYVPLSAILFLQQAMEDSIIPMKQGQAAAIIHGLAQEACVIGSVVGNSSLSKEERRLQRKRLFDNSCEFAKTIPSYILKISRHGRFWEEIEKVL